MDKKTDRHNSNSYCGGLFFRDLLSLSAVKKKERYKLNDYLRKEVKLIKALQGISYKELSEEYLGIRKDSFYSWLHGYYDLGKEKQELLYDVISTLKE